MSKQRGLGIASGLISFLVASAAWATPVTVVVTSTADTLTGCASSGTGECTLRDAITFSNAHPQPLFSSNLIQFNIPGNGIQTITVQSELPTITTAVVIDGYSQPGASPNTLSLGSDAVLPIVIRGPENNTFERIFEVNDGSGSGFSGRTQGGSVIRGLVLQVTDLFIQGIVLESCCNRVSGNFIGVDPMGNAYPNQHAFTQEGITVASAANVIGGTGASDRNVVSGIKAYQVLILGDFNHVEGNYIGTNPQGTTTGLPSIFNGVVCEGQGNVIGGASSNEGNLISGFEDGIEIGRPRALGNLVESNFIGTDATGLLAIPNDVGVEVDGGAEGNSILRNRIAFNTSAGVSIAAFLHDPPSLFNSVLYNSISSNGGLGINLQTSVFDGVTLNDSCDADAGPNSLQNYPVLTSATAHPNTTEIRGTLDSVPNKTYLVQLFSNSTCDPSGYGEGETFIDELLVTTDGGCTGSFADSVPAANAPLGSFITATATDSDGNTSEFSACLQVGLVDVGIRTHIFLVEGPIRVAPGEPVQLRFRVETVPPGQVGDFTGDAIVSDNQGHSCRARVSADGEGGCSLTFDRPGTYLMRGQYLGNASFEESTSPPLPVLVRTR